MTITNHPHRTAGEIIEAILIIFADYHLVTQNKKWKLIVEKNRNYVTKRFNDKDKEHPVTEAKFRIQKVPEGLLEKILFFALGDFAVTIVIPPVHSHVHIHSVELDVMFGNRSISGKDNFLVQFYREILNDILNKLQTQAPELNTRSFNK